MNTQNENLGESKKRVKKQQHPRLESERKAVNKKIQGDSERQAAKKKTQGEPVQRTKKKQVSTKAKANTKQKASAKTKQVQKNLDIKQRLKNGLGNIGKAIKHDFQPKMLKKYTHMYIFPLLFVYFEAILKICTGTSLFAHWIYPVLFGVAFGFFVSFITVIFPKKVNRWISRILLFGTGVIFSIQCLVKRSFQWYMPLSGVFARADNVAGNYLSETISAFFSGIPAIILFLLPGIAYVLLEDKYFSVKRFKFKYALRYLGYSAAIMVFAVLIANIGESGAKYKTQYKFDTATEYFGLITSLRLETKYSIFGNEAAEAFIVAQEQARQEEQESETEEAVIEGENVMELDLAEMNTSDESVQALNTYVESLTPSKKNAYTGLFEGKNLILITAEALSDVVIDKELTPTLYRMTHNGIYFSDFYQPTWGGSTMTGEYSFLVGLVPMKQDQTMPNVKDNNLYFTLGNQLQRKNYYSAAFHNGTYDFYDRHTTHENLGYETFMAEGNGLENYTDTLCPDDETLFDVTLDLCIDQQPFSLYYMTISGHCVYDENEFTEEHMEHVESVLGAGSYEDRTMNYICYQMELEQAMTRLIEKLEQAGILDDTVICMTSDHYPYGLEDTATFGNDQDYVADLYGYDPEYNWEQDHNSLVIWSGCLENEYKDKACEISTPTYSLDVVPTLSNLFGLEYDSRLLVGRDVFSNQEPLVIWNDYSWMTTEGKYNSGTDTFFPNEGSTADESYVERINNIVSNKISFSSKVANIDYYGSIFGEDTETGKAFDWTKEQ